MCKSIPPEIWRVILRLATEDPPSEGPLSFDVPSDLYRQPKISKRTKLALVSVSSYFRQIASEFLYETLNITNARIAGRLADVLGHSSPIINNSNSALSKWTQNIGISINGDMLGDVDVMVKDILYILPLCSNLRRIFMSLHWQRDYPIEEWREHRSALLQAIPASLHVLVWREPGILSYPRTPSDNSCTQTLLHRQSGSLRLFDLSGPVGAIYSLSFPHLTHVLLHQQQLRDFSFLSAWEMPALAHLRLNCYLDGDSTDIAAFWDNVRPVLVSVNLWGFRALSTSLARKILNMSPCLQQLSYSYSPSCADMWQGVKHSSLRDVSIALRRVSVHGTLAGDLLEMLHDHLRPLNISTIRSMKALSVICYDPMSSFNDAAVEERLHDITTALRAAGVEVSVSE